MAIRDLNPLELYFFGPLAVVLVRDHQGILHRVVVPNAGEGWVERVAAAVQAYRARVEHEIAEEGDVSRALAEANAELARIGPWRRVVETLAFSVKSPATRADLLKVSGYGLGQVRSVKEAEQFLLNVMPLVAKRADELKSRGLMQEVVDFPSATLPKLEGAKGALSVERAEATLARGDTAQAREPLVALLEAIEDGIGVLATQAAFLTDPAARKAAEEIQVRWKAAFAEANLRSQQRAANGDVPPGLVDRPAPAPVDGPEA